MILGNSAPGSPVLAENAAPDAQQGVREDKTGVLERVDAETLAAALTEPAMLGPKLTEAAKYYRARFLHLAPPPSSSASKDCRKCPKLSSPSNPPPTWRCLRHGQARRQLVPGHYIRMPCD